MEVCLRYGKPVACGAYTLTEALTAHEAGADFIKAGSAALAAGSSLVAKDFVKNQDWAGLTARGAAVKKAWEK